MSTHCTPTDIWLASFAAWPVPVPPTWNRLPPIASNRCSTRSTSSASPPIITDRVPSAAPVVPPLTGASTARTPRSSARSASDRAVTGSMLLMSTYTDPSSMAGRISSATASTCAGVRSTVMTTSRPATASAALPAAWPPDPANDSSRSSARSKPWTSWPAARRFSAIGSPIRPRPMKPTLVTVLPPLCLRAWLPPVARLSTPPHIAFPSRASPSAAAGTG